MNVMLRCMASQVQASLPVAVTGIAPSIRRRSVVKPRSRRNCDEAL